MLTKTLRTLIERAERNGTAVKRVREGAVMGNHYYVDASKTPLVEQWRVTIQKPTLNPDENWKHIMVDHYGTQIAYIIIEDGKARLHSWYGESSSDRDALNGLCSYYGIDVGFRYRPSLDKFEAVIA